MKMSKKCKVVFTLIMNVPIALSISLTAQLLATGKIIVGLLVLNFSIAYLISFAIGMLLPVGKWGAGFAFKCKAQPDTLKFGLLVNVVINFIYVIINCVILTYFNVIILGKAPIIAYFIGMVTTFVPIYLVGYVVSFLWNRPAE
ncbi:MAG: hypothetical protein ACRC7V_01655, partial [Lachnospiraceae bacterium]